MIGGRAICNSNFADRRVLHPRQFDAFLAGLSLAAEIRFDTTSRRQDRRVREEG